jgi:hypothetical protein
MQIKSIFIPSDEGQAFWLMQVRGLCPDMGLEHSLSGREHRDELNADRIILSLAGGRTKHSRS